jgi:hypothetical protein
MGLPRQLKGYATAPLPLYGLLLAGLYRLPGTCPLVALTGTPSLHFTGCDTGPLGPKALKYP